jgi:CubicO group peptidase (beta-lactamase class C family)
MKPILGRAAALAAAMLMNLAGASLVGAQAPAPGAAESASAFKPVIDYVQSQKTTGFLILRDGKPILERNWPVPADAVQFRSMTYGTSADGAVLEDVASQQKSFVSFLVAVAIDKGLIDVTKPVSAYIGQGWSKATPEQEARIRVLDVLNMSSGLTEQFAYVAAPGTTFFYNTPVYAITKKVVAAAAHQSLDVITKDWLTGPAGMSDTSWRQRPAAMANIGNPTGLVTSPRDAATFGQIVLDGGRTPDGRRLVSEASLHSMFIRSATNPAYGRLWWLNGSAYTIKPLDRRVDGQLIPAAPSDLVAALGALDRKIYVVPSLKLVVVRMGQATPDKDFDQQLWLRLAPLVQAKP